MSPFELPGPEFLALYCGLLVGTTLVAVVLRQLLRGPFDLPAAGLPDLDPYETAYVAGGPTLAFDAAITSLVQRKLLALGPGDGLIRRTVGAVPGLHRVEAAILRAVPDPARTETVATARAEAEGELSRLGQRPESAGLVLEPGRAALARYLPAALLLLLLGFGGVKLAIGLSRGRPIGFLVVLAVVTFVILLFFAGNEVRASFRGARWVKRRAGENAGLSATGRAAPDTLAGEDVALAVALFGMGAFATGELASLRKALHPAISGSCSGSACSSGSSCGGGGCGGGGCGGCGG